jgi:branched-chain amino acid transport system permease protein
VAQLSSFIDGGQGRALTQPHYPALFGSYNDLIFRMGALMAVVAVAVAYAVQHSRLGRGLFAIRDDEDVAEALGTPTFRYKMIAFAISGFLAGAAGGLNALQVSYLTTDTTFNFIVPLYVILMSTLGGRNHWLGPVIGAVLIYSLQERLSGAGLANSSQIILGAVLALTILIVPGGLYARLRSLWRLALTVFVVLLVLLQAFGLFDSVLTRFFVALVVLLPLLIVPPRFFTRLGWFRPRAVVARSAPPAAHVPAADEIEGEVVR